MTVKMNGYNRETAEKVTKSGKETMKEMESRFNGGLSKLLKSGRNSKMVNYDFSSLYPGRDDEFFKRMLKKDE